MMFIARCRLEGGSINAGKGILCKFPYFFDLFCQLNVTLISDILHQEEFTFCKRLFWFGVQSLLMNC